MPAAGRIPVAWSVRLRIVRQLILPVIGFVVTATLVTRLWRQQASTSSVVGQVYAVRVDVPVGTAGRLATLPGPPWSLLDRVTAGDILAQLDTSLYAARLETLQQQRHRLQRELGALETQVSLDYQQLQEEHRREAIRLAWRVEQLRLNLLDRQIQLAADQAEFQRLTGQLEYLHQAGLSQAVAPMQVADLEGQKRVVEQRIVVERKAISEAQTQRLEALSRRDDLAPLVSPDMNRLLAPIQAQLDVHEAQVREIQTEMAQLVVRAPVSGLITHIHAWPGQSLQPGDPLITIAADGERFVVAYVRQHQRVQLREGMSVRLRSRSDAAVKAASHVERVGTHYEPIPTVQLRDVNTPEWGVPVRITLPAGLQLRPGEPVEVLFTSHAAS